MKLLHWFYDQKKVDATYTRVRMAEDLGICRDYLIKIMSGALTPSFRLAFRIEALTKGKVKALELTKMKINIPETRGRPKKVKKCD